MGVSRRQGRIGRTAGAEPYSRVEGRAWHHGQGGMPCTADLCEPPLSRLLSADAALRLPALGRLRRGQGGTAVQVGAAARLAQLSHAARRRTADLAPCRADLIFHAERALATGLLACRDLARAERVGKPSLGRARLERLLLFRMRRPPREPND